MKRPREASKKGDSAGADVQKRIREEDVKPVVEMKSERRQNESSTETEQMDGKEKAVSSRSSASTRGAQEASEVPQPTTCRHDNSLQLLTQKFVKLVKDSSDGVLDLNRAAEHLGVSKRRIYDITNVLEGIGIIKKNGKNNYAWKGCQNGTASDGQGKDNEIKNREAADREQKSNEEEIVRLKEEIDRMTEEETHIDEEIVDLTYGLQSVTSGKRDGRYAYVTYADIRAIEELKRDTLIAVRAPPGTELVVPNPDDISPEYHGRRYQIFLNSSGGPIDCVLVSEGMDGTEFGPNDAGASQPEPSNDGLLNEELRGQGESRVDPGLSERDNLDHVDSMPCLSQTGAAVSVPQISASTPVRSPSRDDEMSWEMFMDEGEKSGGGQARDGESQGLRLSPTPMNPDVYLSGDADGTERPIVDLYYQQLVNKD